MTDVWITIGVLAVATVMIKAAGPLAVGGRPLSAPATRVISLMAPAVLAALVVTGTFAGPDGELTLDARAVGLAAGALAIVLRAPLLVVVVAAAAAAAGARALGAA
jgi:hypothetical protein